MTEILIGIAIVALSVVSITGMVALVITLGKVIDISELNRNDRLENELRRSKSQGALITMMVEKATLRADQAAALHSSERRHSANLDSLAFRDPMTHAEANAQAQRDDDDGEPTDDPSLATG